FLCCDLHAECGARRGAKPSQRHADGYVHRCTRRNADARKHERRHHVPDLSRGADECRASFGLCRDDHKHRRDPRKLQRGDDMCGLPTKCGVHFYSGDGSISDRSFDPHSWSSDGSNDINANRGNEGYPMRKRRRGATTVEMTLVGIPIIFTLICIFEISRGMWMYHTLAYSVKNGVRFAMVHGQNCINGPFNSNSCAKTIVDVATQIQNSAIGPIPAKTLLTFFPGSGGAASTSCYLAAPGANPPFSAHPACSTFNTTWPPDDGTGA